MSSVATDSDDNSIDWLESSENDDNEEEEEEGVDAESDLQQRPDCTDGPPSEHTSTTAEEEEEGSCASPLPMCPLPGPPSLPSPPGGVWLLRRHGDNGRDNARDMDKVVTAASSRVPPLSPRCCTGTTHAQDDQDEDDVVCVNTQQQQQQQQQQHQANAERSNGRRNGVNSQHALRKRSRSPTPATQQQRSAKDHRGPPEMSEKDQVFTRKCMELQCYIHPLSLILTGLRSGRYRERLSSFQESVAMDRIQRIMGVLQNPCMGEKYVNIILKMEEMLKSWFPNVKQPRDQHHTNTTPTQTPEDLTPSKRLKMPGTGKERKKKRKASCPRQ